MYTCRIEFNLYNIVKLCQGHHSLQKPNDVRFNFLSFTYVQKHFLVVPPFPPCYECLAGRHQQAVFLISDQLPSSAAEK